MILENKMYKGMQLVIVQQELGYLCGYVGINNNHKFYGLDYNTKIVSTPDIFDFEQPVGDRGPIDLLCMAVRYDKYLRIGELFNVHGSVTYSSKHNGWYYYPALSDFWFFGFDCNHYNDYPWIWDFERVSKETEKFADQIETFKNADIILYKEKENE